MKFCKDCRWCSLNDMTIGPKIIADATCHHKFPTEPDPVVGTPREIGNRNCYYTRGAGHIGLCGKDAKWFEPKEEK